MFIQPNGQPQYQTTYYTTFFTTNNSFFFFISKQLQYDKFCCTFNECIHKCIRCSEGHPQNSQTTDLLRTNFFSTKGNTLTAVLTTRAKQVRLDHDKV